MMSSIITIMTGGTTPDEDSFYRDFLESASYKIAADSGLDVLYRLQILPDFYLGDSDSVNSSALQWLKKNDVRQEDFPTDKNYSDTHLAIDLALQKGAQEIHLLGGIGSRLDHSLANLYLGLHCYQQNTVLQIIHSRHQVFLLTSKNIIEVNSMKGYYLSIIPITNLEGLTIQGCRWNLQNEIVSMGETRCLSNEIEEFKARLLVKKGKALVIYAQER